MSKDIKLDGVTHDLLIENFDLVIIDELDQLVQNLKIRLWFFFKEWYIDTSKGIRFFDDIMVKNPNLPSIEALLKEEILGTGGVNEILEFQLVFNRAGRSMAVNFKVNTDFGQASIAQPLEVV